MDWFLLFILVSLALLFPTGYAAFIGAPYAPTKLAAVKKAFDEIGLSNTDTLIDLGAGDGKILIEASRRGAHAIGYELSPIMWAVIWLRVLSKRGAISVRYKNFYTATFPEATVVFAFLMPKNMPKVKELLQKQSLPQVRYFLAYAFPLSDIQPLKVIREPQCAALYIYDFKSINRV